MELIPYIIQENPDIEAYWVPRINTVSGLTIPHVQKWLWSITSNDRYINIAPTDMLHKTGELQLLELYNLVINSANGFTTYKKPIINWPDPQMRVFRNLSTIKWVNPVHEKLTGFTRFSNFPWDDTIAIRHFKDIARQEKQNNYYHNYTT
jgi:hypothetical protein